MLFTEKNDAITNDIGYKYYQAGVAQGIINFQKYRNGSFLRDNRARNYEDWLNMNKFAILEMQESLLQKKISGHKLANKINKFIHGAEQRDILVKRDRVKNLGKGSP